MNTYVAGLNNLPCLVDLLGAKTHKFTFPINYDSGRVKELIVVWFRIKLEGKWVVTAETDVPKDKCPGEYPRNIELVGDIREYEPGGDEGAKGTGVDVRVGAAGDNWSLILGWQLGISTKGDTKWKQILNASIDKGQYQENNADFQIWVSDFSYEGVKSSCACLKYHAEVETKFDYGLFPGRGAAVAGSAALKGKLPNFNQLKDLIPRPVWNM